MRMMYDGEGEKSRGLSPRLSPSSLLAYTRNDTRPENRSQGEDMTILWGGFELFGINISGELGVSNGDETCPDFDGLFRVIWSE